MSLRSTIATPAGKQRYVRRMFATIADRYDLITVALSYGRDRRWKDRLVALAALTRDDRMLQIAAAKRRLVRGGANGAPNAPLVTGDMLALPFPAAHFTVVTTGYGLRNVPDLEQAIDEIARVLVPGGRLLSLDFNRPAQPVLRAAYLTYLTIVGSALGFVLHRDPDTYRYIPESIRNYPGAEGVARLLERRGFEHVRVLPLLGGLMAIHTARRSG